MELIMDINLVTSLMAAAVLLSVALVITQSIRLRQDKKRIVHLESMVNELHINFNGLCSGSVGVAKRISRLESKTRQQAERQSRLEHKAPDLQSYGNAARLADKGADMEELVDHCGLSRGEAELILFLNTQQQLQSAH